MCKLSLVYALLMFAYVGVSWAQNCEECLPNMAYCVDEKRYRLCFDGKTPADELESCDTDEFCTTSANICEKKPFTSPVVGGCSDSAGSCGTCGSESFTCVSATQYSLCVNKLPARMYNCASGEFCSTDLLQNHKKMCGSKAVLDFFEYKPSCTNNVLTTTTTTQAPPDMSKLKAVCDAAAAKPENSAKKSFQTANTEDKTCKTYVYCEKINNVMEPVQFKCGTDLFFDPKTGKCGTTACATTL